MPCHQQLLSCFCSLVLTLTLRPLQSKGTCVLSAQATCIGLPPAAAYPGWAGPHEHCIGLVLRLEGVHEQ